MSIMLKNCAIIGFCICVLGCQKEQVTTYEIPKEENKATVNMPHAHTHSTPPPSGQQPPMQPAPGMAEQAGAIKAPKMTAPDSWESKPLGPVRKGSWTIPGQNGMTGEVSVTAFPGDVGGLLANVNRWAGQIGLSPLSDIGLAKVSKDLETKQTAGHLITLVNKDTQKTILAGVLPYKGMTWFFKLTADSTLAESETPAFKKFVETVEFE